MASLNQLRFLVVDDMLTMRKIVSQQLRSLGATSILESHDGVEAWEMLEKGAATQAPIEFIVSDWNMPKMSGIELLRRCRAHAVYKDVAFVMVTAESETDQVRDAVRAGVDNYIIKPFTPLSLQEKINAVLKKRFPPA
jgi:two-component system, chemotaxis family, chemotaxis protein CheY